MKPRKRVRAFLTAWLFWSAAAFATDVSFEWVPVVDADVHGYQLYQGDFSGALQVLHDVPGVASNSKTVTGIEDGTYYFAVRSRNHDGSRISAFSNEIVTTIGPAQPSDYTGSVRIAYTVAEDPPLMAVTVTGTGVLEQSAANGSFAITVPSDADACVLVLTGWDGDTAAGPMVAEISWDDGGTLDFTFIARANYDANYTQIEAYYMLDTDGDWPGTGAKTIYYESDSGYSEGFNLYAFFVKGLDTSDPIGNIDSRSAGGNWTSSLTGVTAGDLVVLGVYEYQAAPDADPSGAGQTLLVENLSNNAGIGVSYEDGESAMQAEGGTIIPLAFAINQSVAGADASLMPRSTSKIYTHLLIR